MDIADTFWLEAQDTLASLEQGLSDLDAGHADAEVINAIFRAAHTLKGAALTVGRRDVGELAHVVEELFSRWRDGRLAPTPSQTRWSIDAVQMLRAQLAGESQQTQATQRFGARAQTAEPMLRVPERAVDALLSVVGEIVLAHGRMCAGIGRLSDEQRQGFTDILDGHTALQSLLRERVMSLRLVPVAPLMSRLRRAAQDTARTLGKEIEFVVEGIDEALDTRLVEGLRDPFMHLLRNSVDHGIETPAVRIAKGKPAQGRIKLLVRKTGGWAVFWFSDDGSGLDRERIGRKARERGRTVDAQDLTSQDLAAFIFEAGFSTAEHVTEVSGRGVGMDVVRNNIRDLRGTIEVRSEPDQGTTFTIRVPLDVTILDCMLVEAAEQNFVVPQERVVEFVDVASPSAAPLSTIRVHDQTLPCIRLAALLGAKTIGDRETVLVLEHAGGRVGLAVDRSHGTQQMVVRSVGCLLRSLPIVAGAAVLGNGDVALLLNIDQIIEFSTRRWARGHAQSSTHGSL